MIMVLLSRIIILLTIVNKNGTGVSDLSYFHVFIYCSDLAKITCSFFCHYVATRKVLFTKYLQKSSGSS